MTQDLMIFGLILVVFVIPGAIGARTGLRHWDRTKHAIVSDVRTGEKYHFEPHVSQMIDGVLYDTDQSDLLLVTYDDNRHHALYVRRSSQQVFLVWILWHRSPLGVLVGDDLPEQSGVIVTLFGDEIDLADAVYNTFGPEGLAALDGRTVSLDGHDKVTLDFSDLHQGAQSDRHRRAAATGAT